MTRATIAETRVLASWQAFQEALQIAIAPLTAEQLHRRLTPELRTPGEIAEHIVYGRALWLQHALGEAATELTPLLRWDEADDPPRTATELLAGLDLTWRHITARLTRGAATDAISDEEASRLQTIWGLLDHDLPHGGELSLLLGAYGLPGVAL